MPHIPSTRIPLASSAASTWAGVTGSRTLPPLRSGSPAERTKDGEKAPVRRNRVLRLSEEKFGKESSSRPPGRSTRAISETAKPTA
jgi:hypothetical protein